MDGRPSPKRALESHRPRRLDAMHAPPRMIPRRGEIRRVRRPRRQIEEVRRARLLDGLPEAGAVIAVPDPWASSGSAKIGVQFKGIVIANGRTREGRRLPAEVGQVAVDAVLNVALVPRRRLSRTGGRAWTWGVFRCDEAREVVVQKSFLRLVLDGLVVERVHRAWARGGFGEVGGEAATDGGAGSFHFCFGGGVGEV